MVIFITGISSGFGKSIAQHLSQGGHTVYGTYRKDVPKIQGVHYIKVDICSADEVRNAIDEIISKENHIDVFINNAGMGIGGPMEFSELDDIERQMDTNWMGFVRCLHFILPVMRKQNKGKIICMSSIGGVMGLPFQGYYSASKFAIEGTAEALRLELKGTDIKIIVIEPGDFATGFTSSRKTVEDIEAYKAYPAYRKYLDCYERDEQNGLKPEYLAGKIVKIINSKNTRYHYVVATPLQKLSVYLKRILPCKLFAYIFTSHYN